MLNLLTNQQILETPLCIITGMSEGNYAPATRKGMPMLEFYAVSTYKRRRLCDGPFAEVLEPLAEWLHHQGYGWDTGDLWFCRIIKFNRWFRAKGFRDDMLERQHVDQYLTERRVHPQFVNKRYDENDGRLSVFRVALALLEEKRFGRKGTPITTVPSPLDDFEAHLRERCGLSVSCVQHYLRWIKAFHLFASDSPHAGSHPVSPAVMLAFVQHSAVHGKSSSSQYLTAALRSYFRYLLLRGHSVQTLLDAVPRVKRGPSPLPERILSLEQQLLWLNGIDRSCPAGRRDYAMALCLCDLGIRAGDLAVLRLDDLDWRKGAIRIPNSKRKRPYWLPLPSRVGRAIATYVQHDRPRGDRREVFLRHSTPCMKPLASANIRARMQKVGLHQGLPRQMTGTHALRHTFATRAYERGTSLKEVADILGHENIESTAIYAKISRRELTQVALPWPEGRP
jgi:integrase/recombinase XerD